MGYVSGSTAKINIELHSNCAAPFIYVRGEGNGGFDIPWTIANLNGEGLYTFITPVGVSTEFEENRVLGYKDFSIDWYVSHENIGQGTLIGTSKNELYVTHNKSVLLDVESLDPLIYHTYLYVSCIAAHGLNDKDLIFNKIYDAFETRKVFKVNSSEPMGYWAGYPDDNSMPPQINKDECFLAAALIAYNNATCGAWSNFLKKIAQTHGIPDVNQVKITWTEDRKLKSFYFSVLKNRVDQFFGAEKINVGFVADGANIPFADAIADPTLSIKAMFFVKNWELPQFNQFYAQYKEPNVLVTTLQNGNTIYGGDVSGLKAQNNDNPTSDFDIHDIIKYNGGYYDPSYGTNNNNIISQNDYLENTISGFGASLIYVEMVNGELVFRDFIYPIRKVNEESVNDGVLIFSE